MVFFRGFVLVWLGLAGFLPSSAHAGTRWQDVIGVQLPGTNPEHSPDHSPDYSVAAQNEILRNLDSSFRKIERVAQARYKFVLDSLRLVLDEERPEHDRPQIIISNPGMVELQEGTHAKLGPTQPVLSILDYKPLPASTGKTARSFTSLHLILNAQLVLFPAHLGLPSPPPVSEWSEFREDILAVFLSAWLFGQVEKVVSINEQKRSALVSKSTESLQRLAAHQLNALEDLFDSPFQEEDRSLLAFLNAFRHLYNNIFNQSPLSGIAGQGLLKKLFAVDRATQTSQGVMQVVGPREYERLLRDIWLAISLLEKGAPITESRHDLYRWDGSCPELKNQLVKFEFMTFREFLATQPLATSSFATTNDRAMSDFFVQEGKRIILRSLIWLDRIAWTQDLKPLKDRVARIAVELAGHTFGIHQYFLGKPIREATRLLPSRQIQNTSKRMAQLGFIQRVLNPRIGARSFLTGDEVRYLENTQIELLDKVSCSRIMVQGS